MAILLDILNAPQFDIGNNIMFSKDTLTTVQYADIQHSGFYVREIFSSDDTSGRTTKFHGPFEIMFALREASKIIDRLIVEEDKHWWRIEIFSEKNPEKSCFSYVNYDKK